MQELFKQIALVAPTDVPVLITGESGTGKELVARAIHRHSARRDRTFLPVCLAALSSGLIERELFGHLRGSFTGAVQDRKGLLELAGGGTVLLDEIGDVPPAVQVKLLRAIEHREVTSVGDARPRPIDVRFLAATNRPLGELMAAGEFREDLFFRLSVFPIRVPPLRDRQADVPALASHFLNLLNLPPGGQVSLRDDVVSDLMSRPWPGNVRELRNAIERGDRRPRPGNPPRAPTPTGRSAIQVGFPRHGSRGDPEPDRPLDRERTSPARPDGDGRLYPLRPLARPCRAALASVTPSPEPGQPRQRRFADRHPSRDAAAEAAEIWDRVTDLGAHDHTRSTRLSDLSDDTHHRLGAGGRYGSSRTGRKTRCVARGNPATCCSTHSPSSRNRARRRRWRSVKPWRSGRAGP